MNRACFLGSMTDKILTIRLNCKYNFIFQFNKGGELNDNQ